MADEAQTIRSINWREVFPFTNLFKAFRVAVHPSKLVLALTAGLYRAFPGRPDWPASAQTRFTSRVRKQNYTQIFTAALEVSGSQLAAQTIGLADELDYQKQERLRELLRDLENCVINGVAPAANQQGSSTVRSSMRGILASMTTNLFVPSAGSMPPGDGVNENQLSETLLNAALRAVWEQSPFFQSEDQEHQPEHDPHERVRLGRIAFWNHRLPLP